MAMRLSGLMSNMDTETIIQELVAARQVKVDDTKKAQTKLSWKQDAWKSLNAKLKNLQTKYLNNMRFSDAYSKRVTKVSNSNAVSVITGANAVNGVQSLQIDKLAKRGYLTGAVISGKTGEKVTALSKLSDITNFSGEGTFSVKTGGRTTDIQVTGETTVSDVLTQLKNAGVNASFDEKNQRFFVSSKESGAINDFSITASDANGASTLSALGLQASLKEDAATLAEYQQYSNYFVPGDRAATLANMQKLIDDTAASRTNGYLEKYKSLMSSRKETQDKVDELNKKYKDDPLGSVEDYAKQLGDKDKEITALRESMKTITDPDQLKAAGEKMAALNKEMSELSAKKEDALSLSNYQKSLSQLDADIADVESYVNITAKTEDDGSVTYSAAAGAKLTGEVEDRYYDKAAYAANVMANYDPNAAAADGATKISGQDAEIRLNGAKFTNTDNVFEINGLTFTALDETNGETVTVTTQDDVDGIYDMVKNFLKEYNSIINEMDKLYNAEPARGYEPLTTEEKQSLSDDEVKEYEDKIKAALLRRDSSVSSISSALKSIMSSGVEVGGKTMYLSDFGINTLGYFESADNEKNAYHIDGDEDDANTSGKSDVLKSMISNDPETVISFFSQLSKNLYAKMDDLSKSVKGYRSFGSFFDDKKMKADYDDYESKIADLQKKLNDYEDKWYAKFSKMETALAKMQSNASAITSLLGG